MSFETALPTRKKSQTVVPPDRTAVPRGPKIITEPEAAPTPASAGKIPEPGQKHDVPPLVREVLASPGQPLDAETRAFMEPRFGHDFSRVRVHSDAPSAESARDVNALAYTVGEHIVFGNGRYSPQMESGRHLLAHELAHVVQLGGDRPLPGEYLETSSPDEPLETIANQAAGRIGAGRFSAGPSAARVAGTPSARLFRQTQANPGGGGGASGPRIVHLDTSVIDQINRGNTDAAEALKRLKASGAQVSISTPVYTELTQRGADLQIRKGNELLISELGMRRVPTGSLEIRSGVYDQYARSDITKKMEKDLPIIAAAKEDGAELWTFDSRLNTNAEKLGVHIIPESSLPFKTGSAPDYTAARKLFGLERVEISPAGIVRRFPPGGGGGGSTAGGGGPTEIISGLRPEGGPTEITSGPGPKGGPTEITGGAGQKGGPTNIAGGGTSQSGTTKVTQTPTPLPGPTDITQTATAKGIPTEISAVPALLSTTTENTPSAGPIKTSGTPFPARPTAIVSSATPGGRVEARQGEKIKPIQTPDLSRAEALNGAITLWGQWMHDSMERISEQQARADALTAFAKNQNEFFDRLWKSPGQGMEIWLVFKVIPAANPDFPTLTSFDNIYFELAFHAGSMQPLLPGFSEGEWNRGAHYSSTRLWLPPVRMPGPRTVEPTEIVAKPEEVPVVNLADFLTSVSELFTGSQEENILAAYEVLKRVQNNKVPVGKRVLLFWPTSYPVILSDLQTILGDRLTRRWNRLTADLAEQQSRLDKFLGESSISKIGARGRDVSLDPHMYDDPRSHLASAKNNIDAGALRDARNSLQRAENLLSNDRAWLYRYETGEVSALSSYEER